MIWYNIKKLEAELIQGPIPDRDGFSYLLSYFVLGTMVSYLGDDGYNYEASRWIDCSLDLVVTIVGISMTWRTNSSGDGSDYFTRFISLSFVNAVRVIVKFVLTSLLLYIMIRLFLTENFITGGREDVIQILLSTLFQLIFFDRVNKSFKNVSAIREISNVVR
jgi:hypothetical protein